MIRSPGSSSADPRGDRSDPTTSSTGSAGVPLTVVSKTLRHSTLSTTATIYSHLTRQATREAVDIIDRTLAAAQNTDHYVLEAKWWKEAVGRRELDVFKANIERKGKNTLGLYVSMSGYSSDALAVYSYSTPFITMDGSDFMAVLDQRIRLDDLLDHKKRHASQTGHCYLPVAKVFSGSE
ncbi:restriction endonuclease [Streptomyces goshikiensis]|uniref:restriction endonuclease n=1 Tax=Streptomyces goshikiensis TaxID=1942 RepID=UPI0036B3D971